MIKKKHISTCKIWQIVGHNIKNNEKGHIVLKIIPSKHQKA